MSVTLTLYSCVFLEEISILILNISCIIFIFVNKHIFKIPELLAFAEISKLREHDVRYTLSECTISRMWCCFPFPTFVFPSSICSVVAKINFLYPTGGIMLVTRPRSPDIGNLSLPDINPSSAKHSEYHALNTSIP